MSELPLVASGPLKSALIALAFEDCGMSDLTVSPEEKAMALRRLNSIMLEEPWSNMGYTQPEYGNGDAEEPCGLAVDAVNAVVKHLAFNLMGVFEKEPTSAFRSTYAKAKLQAAARYATIATAQFASGTATGAGNRDRYTFDPFFPEPV
jgi:hypothetical protein